ASSYIRGHGNQNYPVRPYVPLSLPFLERLIGAILREDLDPLSSGRRRASKRNLLFSTGIKRTHASLNVHTPEPRSAEDAAALNLRSCNWKRQCRGCIKHR